MTHTSIVGLPGSVTPPRWETSAGLPHEMTAADVLAVPVLTGTEDVSPFLGPGADEVGQLIGIDLLDAVATLGHTGSAGEVLRLPAGAGRMVLLVGVGTGSDDDVRRAGAAVGRATLGRDCVASTVSSIAGPSALTAFVAGLTLASFGLRVGSSERETSQNSKFKHPVRRVVLAGTSATLEADLTRAVAVAEAGWLARALATVPSNIKNPAWLAEQAETIAGESGLEVEIWDEQQLAREGFGGVVAVGQGSATPARLIRLTYAPAGATRKTPTVALVGKGITFDSGGLSIKPGESMSTMKRDMTGGAVVMAVMGALAAIDCPVRVEALVPAAENAVGAASMRPGDVITHYGGRTTEVTNTDAEGRLVLADAMAWAVEKLKPAVLIDIATLTGAMKVALGLHTAGFFATQDGLARSIEASGRASGERVWRLPLSAEYEGKLASEVADADNAPGGPGAITAALFLQHFTGGIPWVHLDVAPVGDTLTERDEWTEGPSGFGARLLLDWLGAEAPLDALLDGLEGSTS